MTQLDTAAGVVGALAASAVVYATVLRMQRPDGRRPPEVKVAAEGTVSGPPLADQPPRAQPAAPVRARRVTLTHPARTPRPGATPRPAPESGPWELLSLIGTMQWDRALSVIARAGADLPGVAALAEAAALERVRALPDSEVRLSLGGWRVLAALSPMNRLYADRIAQASAQLEARREALLEPLTRDEDRQEPGTVWLDHPWNARFDDQRRPIWPYIGVREGARPRLRLRTNWLGETRIAVQGLEVVHDGVTETLTAGAYKIDADALGWEWRDEPADLYQIEVLRSLVGAGEVRLRYLGDPWSRETLLSNDDRKAISETVELFDLLCTAATPREVQAA